MSTLNNGDESAGTLPAIADTPSLRRELSLLWRANRELEARLAAVEASPARVAENAAPASGTTVAEVEVTPGEADEIRRVFEAFDTDASGRLSVEEIAALHQLLGDPLTAEEAQAAAREMLAASSGAGASDTSAGVDLATFTKWWVLTHRGGRRNVRYAERFKLVRARLEPARGFDLAYLERREVGVFGTLEYRLQLWYRDGGEASAAHQISPWHDIPLRPAGAARDVVHFICEIPKWTRAKMEISTREAWNPIKQDTRNGKLRDYVWGDMYFNYGALPQTYEKPDVVPATGHVGDNDPLDAIEVGVRPMVRGGVKAVKVLGVMPLIDSGETDWKVLCIALDDPFADRIHTLADFEREFPTALDRLVDFLRVYKVPLGLPPNEYAVAPETGLLDKEYALNVIDETSAHWHELTESGRRELAAK